MRAMMAIAAVAIVATAAEGQPPKGAESPQCQALVLAAEQLSKSGNYLGKVGDEQYRIQKDPTGAHKSDAMSADDLDVAIALRRLHFRTCR